ncbi:glycosyltransferase [Kurthia sibirica]|uniref:Glycosyl transferase n=1 Tax=Kurthia sibirica TaxID=202750 RepID=A0A2U3AKY6_9BACL|nr:glycosyltransferase [Kurthia sibirica]PWI25207.1 glycosyl transferase [Kurthia sibirica]GEK35191.1 hypothetical protein KSI01_27240 [Kurthia sibirica]
MKRKIFMVVYDIDVNKGGINSVMFSRTHLFNNDSYSSDIVTLDDKLNYPEIVSELHDDGRLNEQSSIINIYDFYRNKFTSGGINEDIVAHYNKNMQKEEPGYHFYFDGTSARYFDNGRYVKYKRWTEDGKLSVVDYFSDMRVRETREEYHPDGYLLRKMTYHPADNNVNQEHYFTKEGFCYLSRWFNHVTGKQQRVVLFSPDKQNARVFSTNLEFHSYFLDELCSTEDTKPVVICDGPGSSAKVQRMKKESASKIYTIHRNHLQEPFTLGSKLKADDELVLMNEDREAPIVVLTNRQKIDIEAQFPEMKWNIHVISHAMPIETVEVEKKDNLIVVVSRLSKAKRLNLLIEAFKKTSEEVPDAKLHIYGSGVEKAALLAQIKELKLTKKVRLIGYTTEPKVKLAQALFTVNTSAYEGQSLTCLEAFSMKTAALSFKINYLVREMYQEGVTGALVENNNVDELAAYMTDWLYNPEKVKQYGEQAYNIIRENYTLDKQYNEWHHLIQTLQ